MLLRLRVGRDARVPPVGRVPGHRDLVLGLSPPRRRGRLGCLASHGRARRAGRGAAQADGRERAQALWHRAALGREGADRQVRARDPSLVSEDHMNHETATALDPQAKAVIDLVIKSGRPPYHQLSPKEARQMFRDTRAACTPVPPEIGAVKDLTADGPAGPIALRLYSPKSAPVSTPLPALVFFHGGGWGIGDLDTHDVFCRQLAA